MKKLIFLSATTLACAASFGAIRAVTPTAWNGDTNCWQLARHNANLKYIATNGGEKVVFIGDSITHFWESTGRAQWQKFFAAGPRKALQLGTSADRTEHVLWRLQNGELDGYEAKCILLMIGTNNSGHFPFAKETPIDTIYGIKEILRVIREKQPKARTILTAIFPTGADGTSANRRRNDVVNKEIAKFADGKSVIWCDFSDKFLDAEGRLSREIFPDLLHPNALGYEMWASAVVPLIDKVLAAAPDEAIPSVWPSHPYNYSLDNCYATRPTPAYGVIGWWDRGRPLEKRNEIVDGPGAYDVVMVGDSITHRWEREGGEGRELFAELKKTYSILNLGTGGDQTQHVIWRLENGELEGYTAKMFTVMIGTNNGGRDINGIAAGVKRIVELIRTKHPESKVVLMPIFPRGEKPDNANRVANEKVNAIIKGYADGKDVRWLDFNGKFLEPDGTLTKKVMNDLLHPNENGYRIWWENMGPVVKEIVGK